MTTADEPILRIAQVVPRTEAEGPGVRFAVWVQGCPMRCAGCCNPEMLAFAARTAVAPEALAQGDGLAHVARGVRAAGLSVMVFSGYTLAEIAALPGAGPRELLAATDLLV